MGKQSNTQPVRETPVDSTRAETGRQSVPSLDLSWECAHWVTQNDGERHHEHRSVVTNTPE